MVRPGTWPRRASTDLLQRRPVTRNSAWRCSTVSIQECDIACASGVSTVSLIRCIGMLRRKIRQVQDGHGRSHLSDYLILDLPATGRNGIPIDRPGEVPVEMVDWPLRSTPTASSDDLLERTS